MINPFKDTNWNPDLAARRGFAKSLMIGFPVIALIFTLIGWLNTHTIPAWTLWLAAIGAGAGLVFWLVPQIAKPFYLGWYFIACCMGIVVSNLLIAAFYYLVITPTGLIMRALGRDPMTRRWEKSRASYWRDAEKIADPKRYWRQF
ncbi:MAG: SxtJ family membrane protein [Chthoniobacteraceae bacterium]